MDQLFGNLKGFFKTNVTFTDNFAFRLHYRVTVPILLAFSILVTCRQYIGDPIDCITKDSVPSHVLDTFCWIHTTFSMPDAWKKRVGYEVPYPGVDTSSNGSGKRIYHAYYQWVCFVLFLQAALFYVPRYLWKMVEGGRVKNIILGLDSPIMDAKDKASSRKMLLEYLIANRNYHNFYFWAHSVTEVLNFVNIIGQIYLMDAFLGGEFSTYGSEVLNFTQWSQEVRYDPMVRVFPRLTKCSFHMYGSSGDVQRHDAMCILPINIINEKIYVFLWFWFAFMAAVSGLALIYRAAIILRPGFRTKMTLFKNRLVDEARLRRIVERSMVGDWLILHLVCKNIDALNYRDLIEEYDQALCESKREP